MPPGEDKFFLALWLLDVVSFVAFFFLLHRTLQRYGFGPRLAAL